jgi:hypothetical protein
VGGVLVGEITFSGLIGVFIGLGILGAIPFWYTRRYLKIRDLKPTEKL